MHRAAHHAGVARDLVLHMTIVILVPAVARSLDHVEGHAHHPGLALAMATLEISAQMSHAPSAEDALAHLRIVALDQIPATTTLETTCTLLEKILEVHLLAPTTDVHVVTADARAVVDVTTLTK